MAWLVEVMTTHKSDWSQEELQVLNSVENQGKCYFLLLAYADMPL